MKVATSELEGAALDWAVGKAGGWHRDYPYSTDWVFGGPIIDRAVVSLGTEEGAWRALCWGMDGPNRELYSMRGPTALVAAMRCFVSNKLGDTVEVPDELMEK
jgi:hypothetical protein